LAVLCSLVPREHATRVIEEHKTAKHAVAQ